MRNIFIITLILLLSSCSSVGRVGVETAVLNQAIGSGQVQEDLMKVDYTVAEEQVITHALNSVAAFRASYGAYIERPATLLSISPNKLRKDYLELRNRFDEVEDIVISNYDRYDEETQKNLTEYSIHAYKLDAAVEDLMAESKYRSAIKKALSYGFATLQLVAALKP